MSTDTTERRAIKRAAEIMDKARPKWYRRIVFKRLDMADPCNCIAGQAGLDWAELEEKYESTMLGRALTIAPFASYEAEPLWIDEVRARRAAEKKA